MLNLTKSYTLSICSLLYINYTFKRQRGALPEGRRGGGGGGGEKKGGIQISDLTEAVWEIRLVKGK